MAEEEFLQESVKKLLGEIYNYQVVNTDSAAKDQLKGALFDKLKEYDNEFYKKYNKVPMSEISHQMSTQEAYKELPEAAAIQANLMRNTFVSDAGYLTRYQRLHKITTSVEPQALNFSSPPPPPERNYENEFIDTRFQYKDPNMNQKAYLANKTAGAVTLEQRDKYLADLENNKYQQDLLTLMKQPQIVGDDGQPTISNHKQQIQKLGGLEDTVGAMEKSLNELQLSSKQPLSRAQNGGQYGAGTANYRQMNQREGNDTFLKEYSQNVKPNSSISLVEKSKQMREEMMRKLKPQ